MKIFDFIRDAGEKLKSHDDDKAKAAEQPVRTREDALEDRRTADALARMIVSMKLDVQDLKVKFMDGKAVLEGKVPSQETREKVVLVTGNARGVAQVEDRLKVVRPVETAEPEPEAVMYTVKSGDTLSKIAKEHYGAASKYMKIFEANQPMLKNPDKIYPGQVLRIPK